MSHRRGYIALSENVTCAAGSQVAIPLKLGKGHSGRGSKKYAHVTKLFLVLTGVSIAVNVAAGAADAAFWSKAVSNIQVDASADSPFGLRKGGQLVKNMSLYLALTAMNQMTGAPMLAFGAGSATQIPDTGSLTDTAPEDQYNATMTPRVRKLHGRMTGQGPFGSAGAGNSLTPPDGRLAFTLPIGERIGEPGCMNPIPLAYLNGGGGSCSSDCPAKSEGSITLTMASAIDGMAFTVTNCRVFAEIVYMDKLNAMPLQPWVTTYQTTDLSIQLEPAVHGWTALCEDLNGVGSMVLTDVTGVSQFKLTVRGQELFESQYPEARIAFLGGNTVNGPDHTEWSDHDPSAASMYAGTYGRIRYNVPYFGIVNHKGDTGSDPTHEDGASQPVCFELVNASSTSNRRVLRGVWLPNDAEYAQACEKFAGAPLLPNVAMSALASQKAGLMTGIPASAEPVATVPNAPKPYVKG